MDSRNSAPVNDQAAFYIAFGLVSVLPQDEGREIVLGDDNV